MLDKDDESPSGWDISGRSALITWSSVAVGLSINHLLYAKTGRDWIPQRGSSRSSGFYPDRDPAPWSEVPELFFSNIGVLFGALLACAAFVFGIYAIGRREGQRRHRRLKYRDS